MRICDVVSVPEKRSTKASSTTRSGLFSRGESELVRMAWNMVSLEPASFSSVATPYEDLCSEGGAGSSSD